MNLKAPWSQYSPTGLVLLVPRGVLADQSPGNNAQQLTNKCRDQVFKGDLDFAKTLINVEQPENESSDNRTDHPKANVGP
jgi:hypothetical protein